MWEPISTTNNFSAYTPEKNAAKSQNSFNGTRQTQQTKSEPVPAKQAPAKKKAASEKETAVKLGLLTALAGESMFMLGAPGCAKSMITRRIKEAFKADDKDGVKYFETLLNQFTTPEEVFGNIS